MLLKSRSPSTVSIGNSSHCGDEFHADGQLPNGEQAHRTLTRREKQVIDLIGQAKLNKEIAYQLQLTEGTVKQYIFGIFRKLDVTNRTELALWSLRHPDEWRSAHPGGEGSLLDDETHSMPL
jgi:DNA-binding NarL/FixJ family response regulator